MNRWKPAFGVGLIVAWSASAVAFAQHDHGGHAQQGEQKKDAPKKEEQKPGKLPLCPVMGDPVDFSVRTITDDGPVYFCCDGCIKKFEKDPDRYSEKLSAQREALAKMERIQVLCPVSGNPVDGKTTAVIEDKPVSFCCDRCVPKYDKQRAKYKARLEASYTYQIRCPVSGDKIDPTAFADLPTGQRIYLCCPGCGEKLLKDPAKYAPKLAEQGINLDLKKLKGEKTGHEGHGEQEGGHP
jgi:YHS domain-containing protein